MKVIPAVRTAAAALLNSRLIPDRTLLNRDIRAATALRARARAASQRPAAPGTAQACANAALP
jgi:hypothetical protein